MDSLVVEMQPLLDNPCNGRSQEDIKTSIYRVPPLISGSNEKAYRPRVVSFGPYHYGEPQLVSMEPHKKRAFHQCIQRSKRTIPEVFDFILEMAPELKDSYDSLDPKWRHNTEGFVKLMILDGCFMLEVLNVYQYETYYSENDPVFSPHGEFNVMHLIRADMLMLENQLPMSLLIKLKSILENDVDDEPDIEDLNTSILWFLNYEFGNYPKGERLHVLDVFRESLLHIDNEYENANSQSPGQGEADNPKMANCLHKLNLCCKRLPCMHSEPRDAAAPFPIQRGRKKPPGFVPVVSKKWWQDWVSKFESSPCAATVDQIQIHQLSSTVGSKGESRSQGNASQRGRKKKRDGHNVVRPATELREAGIHFKNNKSKCLRDITFDFNNGVLTLPNFVVQDFTESIFLNLIAFERCHPPASSDITSFVEFMDHIIDDSRDIKLLSSKGIINNYIGTDKEAADLFNTMSKGLAFAANSNLFKVYNEIIDYSNRHRNKWRANLIQTYFRSPWAVISVIAACLLFSLATVQTIFTILN